MGEIIPAGVLTLMRTQVTAYNLPDTGSLYTKVETNSSQGQVVTAGALIATVACREGLVTAQQTQADGSVVTFRHPAFSLPAGTAATTEQLWVFGGTTYEITEVRDRGSRAVAVVILVAALEA